MQYFFCRLYFLLKCDCNEPDQGYMDLFKGDKRLPKDAPACAFYSNFQLQKLEFAEDKIALRRCWGAVLFFALFPTIGLFALVLGLLLSNDVNGGIIAVLTGSWFILGGTIALAWYCRRRLPEFDLLRERFYPADGSGGIPLSDLRSIQVMKFRAYEVNAIFSGSRRFNLVSGAGLNKSVQDARRLAEKFNVPLVDEYRQVIEDKEFKLRKAAENYYLLVVFLVLGLVIMAALRR